jgi:3-oxoacyl-[acyl-carrier-protein] synthase III
MSHAFPPPKPWTARQHCQILSYAEFCPPRTVSNQEIIAGYGHTIPAALVRRTVGVESRRVAEPDQADSDLLALAARSCLESANLPVDGLSRIFCNKFVGDRILPPTASIVQRKLGASVAFPCMDIDGGSNSFLQAFEMAAKCIAIGDGPILLASGGIAHGVVSKTDPRTAFLYGDGAAAILLAPSQERHILSSYFFSNPEYIDLHRTRPFVEFASIDREAPGAAEQLRNQLQSGNWKDSLEFLLLAASTTVRNLLQEAGMDFDSVDRFLVSESNGPLWEAIVNHLGIPPSKTLSLLAQRGNTMSANLPMQLCAAQLQNPLPSGATTLFLSFGEGISGGGILYRH